MDAAKATCGKPVGVALACKSKTEDSASVLVKNCHSRGCPICFRTGWAGRQARAASDKLIAGGDLYERVGESLGRGVRHIVFSPDQDSTVERVRTVEGFEDIYRELHEVVQYAGLNGYMVVFHPFRQVKDWRGEKIPGRWYESPHFHVLGYGWLMKSDRFNEATGWIYYNVDSEDGKVRDRDEIRGTIKYLLTHAGISYGPKRFQVVRWAKMIANCKMGRKKYSKITDKPVKCECCETDLHRYEDVKVVIEKDKASVDFTYAVDRGVYHKVLRVTVWYLRKYPDEKFFVGDEEAIPENFVPVKLLPFRRRPPKGRSLVELYQTRKALYRSRKRLEDIRAIVGYD